MPTSKGGAWGDGPGRRVRARMRNCHRRLPRLESSLRSEGWIDMVKRHGAANAARRILESGDIQSGFERLIRSGRMDLTVEMAVLHPRWETLFSRSHREAAWWRLAQATRATG